MHFVNYYIAGMFENSVFLFQAQLFFQKLLGRHKTPDQLFKMICDYFTQGGPHQRKLSDGILRMLADEVSRHLEEYPSNMLPPIADLYGSILAASTHV